MVAASSASVYGMAEQFPTTEAHHPYDNRTLYGAAKAFNEGLLRSFNDMYGLDYVALRYFNVYGPRMDIHGRYTEVLMRWMERIEAGEPPIIFGDGLQTMDFDPRPRHRARQHAGRARPSVTDEVFNVGSGTETSLLELAAALAAVMGRPQLAPEHRGRARGQPGAAAARRRPARRASCSASRPSIAARGGLARARRLVARRARSGAGRSAETAP